MPSRSSRPPSRRFRVAVLVTALSLLLCRAVSQAQDSGPGFVLQGEGGLVTVLVLDPSSPSTVFASTARGIYRSADSGAHWEPRNRGLEDHSVLALAVDPAAHGTLYATTDTGGVYKSPDGGNRWTAANQGLASRYVGVVAVQGRAVYAGTEAGRIFRSVDAAATWVELTPPTTRVAVTAIAVDPSDGVIYAGTNSEGVFRSSDAGSTWVHAAAPLSRGTVWGLVIDPTKSSTVYAATHDGLFRSDDAGATWKGLHKNLRSGNVLALAIDPETPRTLYAATAIGIYKSLDAGSSWAMLNSDLFVTALSLDPSAPAVLYAGTHLGVLKSVDAGATWSPLHLAPNSGLPPGGGVNPAGEGAACDGSRGCGYFQSPLSWNAAQSLGCENSAERIRSICARRSASSFARPAFRYP